MGQLGTWMPSMRTVAAGVDGLSSGMMAVTTGAVHACALTTGGGVKCWGSNQNGQLGSDSWPTTSVPADVEGMMSGVTALAAGHFHTCGLMSGGGVKCWGANWDGQLGNGTATERSTAVDVVELDGPVTALAGGHSHTCALLGAGGVKCWGDNEFGQLGDGTTADKHAPVEVAGLGGPAIAIAAGERHTCAVMSDGGVKCWGSNLGGQLGDGSMDDRQMPVDVIGLGSQASAVTAGRGHTCALTSVGVAKCWGGNGWGQLGDGTLDGPPQPRAVHGLDSGVVAVSAGGDHACALTADGGVKCWGGNWIGQLGVGTPADHYPPVDVAGLNNTVSALTAGWQHTCALTEAGTVQCWGLNTYGQLGNGTQASGYGPMEVNGLVSEVAAVAAGVGHTCTLTASGAVKCWGWNTVGQLGDGTVITRTAPVDVVGLGSAASAVTSGDRHTCALTSGGSAQCWGWNGYGQLGDGTWNDRHTPAGVLGLDSDVAALSAGGGHTCALTTSGVVKCWGGNWAGQLGDGTTDYRQAPVAVTGLGQASAVTTGSQHTCALTIAGGVKCWGSYGFEQSGNRTPVDVIGLDQGVTAIASGNGHACALMTGGGVKCWGANWAGQLGVGRRDPSDTPLDVRWVGGAAVALTAGGQHTCALTAGGAVKCWGANNYGQLGVNPGWAPLSVLEVYKVFIPGLTRYHAASRVK
jgi:alpha-tubulin suppressor-like RCC1 family protein